MFDYNKTFAESNTIACAHTGREIEACGKTNGEYKSNGYHATITPIYAADDVELRSVEHNGTIRYEVLLDNEVFQKFPSLKNATVYFLDFSGMRKSGLKEVQYHTFTLAQYDKADNTKIIKKETVFCRTCDLPKIMREKFPQFKMIEAA